MNKEQAEILFTFAALLNAVSGDGQNKRARGEKPHWRVDDSHETAMYNHLAKWLRGERRDCDSGAHPLTHMSWRGLAVATKESDTA